MESRTSKTKREYQMHTIVLSETLSGCDPSKQRRGPDLEGRCPGAMRDACYEEQQCLAFLMSAGVTGAMLEPGPMDLGRDRKNSSTAKGKVSIQRRSRVASSKCTGRAARGRGR